MSEIIASVISGTLTVAAVGLSGYFQLRATGKVHTLVNNRSAVQDTRIEQLTKALTGNDVEVPDRPEA
jgi:hypothetical protein